MESIFEHFKKTGYLHHAHLIEGDKDTVTLALLGLLEKHMGVFARNNPNYSLLSYKTFGIDEARALSESQSRAGFSEPGGLSRKLYLIAADSFTHQAQNALLKTFEEPTLGTHFFIIVPHVDNILPTLRSRLVVASLGKNNSDDETRTLAQKFLAGSLGERFAMSKKLTEKKGDEPIDREKIRRMFDHIERILYTQMAGKPDQGVFAELYHAKKYLADNGSSAKMLCDHLAIAVPR